MSRFLPAALHDIHWPQQPQTGSQWLNHAGLRRILRSLVSVPTLISDIRDIVYLNWMVPVERVAHFLPPSLKLQVFNGNTPLSILTYRHGHFGPQKWGSWRRMLCLSPVQSNWRLYLDSPKKSPQIYFFKTCLSSPLYTIGSRLFSDGLPAHYAPLCIHRRQFDSTGYTVLTHLDPGAGSAADLQTRVREATHPDLPPAFAQVFASWPEAISYLIDQQAAITQLDSGELWRAQIELPMSPQDAIPLKLEHFYSRWLQPVVGHQTPLAFGIPQLRFRALGEGPL